ncbi:flagellar hook-basal body complex protein [Dehalobacter sp. DCM]|uniref:flagellar hook-basal body complex protein n=1 Tax=Dehalobacter sp. DCM TaxID=2907827 RepID=UPI0030814BEE|nr:flagellar hook-basal body complex protein [Dehalobacter sp. DCM]
MMRSLYSAITGLKNHQTSMDVIGNNIANVNTAGYKRERASFATMLGQAIQDASKPTTGVGGTNGIAVGLGSVLGSVEIIGTQGSSQYTGKDTDMMIQGSGFFVLNQGGTPYYTRTGNFGFDENGYLVDNNTGAYVQGYLNQDLTVATPTYLDKTLSTSLKKIKVSDADSIDDADTTADPLITGYSLDSYSIDSKGVITGVFVDNSTGIQMTREIARIALASFSNPTGLSYEGNNFYTTSNNSGTANLGYPGDSGKGGITTSYLEMSNVDLSQEFTDMIVTQRGFQANSRVITVSDSLLEELINLKRS